MPGAGARLATRERAEAGAWRCQATAGEHVVNQPTLALEAPIVAAPGEVAHSQDHSRSAPQP
jgi:hypothetical protein